MMELSRIFLLESDVSSRNSKEFPFYFDNVFDEAPLSCNGAWIHEPQKSLRGRFFICHMLSLSFKKFALYLSFTTESSIELKKEGMLLISIQLSIDILISTSCVWEEKKPI